MEDIVKVIKILNARQRRNLVILFIIMFVGSFVELLGVSLIMPLVSVITTPESINRGTYALIGQIFQLGDVKDFVVFFSLALIFIYIFKNIYLIIEYDLQYRYTYNNKRELSVRIMRCYLKEDYQFHAKHNPMELQRDITADVDSAFETLLAVIQLMTEAIVCVMLVIYLLYTDIVSTLMVFAVAVIFIVIFMKIYKKYTYTMGVRSRDIGAERSKWLNQALCGIKELKVMDTEDYFVDMFSKTSSELATLQRKRSILGVIPRPILETIMITVLLATMLVRILMGVELNSFVPVLSIFVVSAFRMLPSFNRITAAYNNIMFSKSAVNALYDELEKVKAMEKEEQEREAKRRESAAKKGHASQNVSAGEDLAADKDLPKSTGAALKSGISVRGLTFAYDEKLGNVLEDISLDIKDMESTAIIGETGSGKTTLADLLLGILKPKSGDIYYNGESIYDHMKEWHQAIGYIPQVIYLTDDTILKNVAFGKREEDIDEAKVWTALREAQLEDFVKGLPDGINTEVGDRGIRLSGGQRQRIGIARALYSNPGILIMDEATSALDNETEEAVMEAIDSMQGSRTIIIIAHRLTTIRNCNAIYRVEQRGVSRVAHEEIFN